MKKMDMLHGSIADKTCSFALLLAMTGICQQLLMQRTSSLWAAL